MACSPSMPDFNRFSGRGQLSSLAVAKEISKIRPNRGGFSLIEVTLSLAVVSFAFLSVFGLLPLGLNTFHSAIDISVGSQISQCIMNDLQETDFNTLTATPPGIRYFDNQGIELTSQAGATYQVNVQVTAAPLLPGASAVNSNLASVVIQIACNPGHHALAKNSSNLWSEAAGVSMTTYSTMIAGNSASGSH